MFLSRGEPIPKNMYKTHWKNREKYQNLKKKSCLYVLHFDYLPLMSFLIKLDLNLRFCQVFFFYFSHMFVFNLLLDQVFHLVFCTAGFYSLVFALNLQYNVSLLTFIFN